MTHKDAIALTVDSQQRLAFCLSRQSIEISDVVHRLTVDAFNHIAFLQAELSGRAVRIKLDDHHARHVRGHTRLIAEGGSEVLHLDAAQGSLLNGFRRPPSALRSVGRSPSVTLRVIGWPSRRISSVATVPGLRLVT